MLFFLKTHNDFVFLIMYMRKLDKIYHNISIMLIEIVFLLPFQYQLIN